METTSEHPKIKTTSVFSKLCTSLTQLILQGVLGYFAYLFSTDPYYFGDELECVILRKWTYRYSILVYVVIVWDLIHITVSIVAESFESDKILRYTQIITNLIYPFIFLLFFAIFMILSYSYLQSENCGTCGTFILVILILFWLTVALFISCIGCSLVLCIEAVKGIYRSSIPW